MGDAPSDTVTQRLDRLERGNRGIKLAGTLALLALSTLLWIAQAPSKSGVVEAERFILRSADGKARAELGMVKGGPTLSLFNDTGERYVSLSLMADGSAVLALNAIQGGRVLLNAGTKATQLGLLDHNGNPHVVLTAAGDGSASMSLVDQARTLRAALVLEQNGSPGLILFNQAGKPFWSTP